MPALSAPDLLDAWEHGLGRPPVEQALALTLAAIPGASLTAVAELTVGERDARLIDLWEQSFGSSVTATATCPSCAEDLELVFGVADLRTPPSPPAQRLSISCAGYEMKLRQPTGRDLLACRRFGDFAATRAALFAACVVSARRGADEMPAAALPDEVVAACDDALAEADPQADLRIDIACPDCGHAWEATLDVVGFLWARLDAWALRLLHDLHLIASAYGWRESEILALSPARRRYYLEAIGG
ncbi:T4 family baseplate hub assembly chaperone [Jidongwangia harbinensis]|uniref:T4 family baseplate hub assembly chaperone n=1 Tax=Jidongwangia harbinensis TaxID=2878561 RepID=UPI001CDA0CA0|nr:hypothetical protein [Jidongwangia harbinensis]MCA2218010.1 hypothetical protein [Jidongwangia harbinensis]